MITRGAGGLLLLAGLLAACSGPPEKAALRARWVATMRREAMQAPIGACFAGGALWVSDPTARGVFRLEPGKRDAGEVVAELSGQLSLPMHLVAAGDRIFVPDYLSDRVVVATLQGKVLSRFGEHGSGAGQLDAPAGVAVGPDGSCYVADFNNHRVVRFDRAGRPAGGWGKKGHAAPGEFYYPTDVAVGGEGEVYVADAYNYRIQVFSGEGHFLRMWGRKGAGPGEFDVPVGIGIDAQGRIHVADQFNYRIQVFSPEGRYLGGWGGKGTGKGRFDRPSDVAFDARGRVYVTDYGNRRVQVFEPAGGREER